MASRLGALWMLGLFVGCGAAIAGGCSSDSSKKVPFGEAGEGGEAGATVGGSGGKGGSAGTGVVTPEGGAAGEAPIGEAGQGGAVSTEGGAAGAAPIGGGGTGGGAGSGGASGSGGAVAACTPMGTTSNLSLNGDGALNVCRGAYAVTTFNASTSATTFTCCAAWDTASLELEVQGVTLASDDGYFGNATFLVPDTAPLGMASLTMTCAGGVSPAYAVNVTETAPPNVEGLEEDSIATSDQLMVDGTNLSGVTRVDAISIDDPTVDYECTIDPDNRDDLDFECSFDGIQPGQYYVLVQADNCGAVKQPILTIIQPTL